MHRHRPRLSLSLSVCLCSQISSTPVKAVSLTATHMPVLMYASCQRHRDFECWPPRGPADAQFVDMQRGRARGTLGRPGQITEACAAVTCCQRDGQRGRRCRGNSSPPHRRISTLFRTLSFFSFPFLFLPWLLGRYLSNYLFNKTCDLSYTYLPMSPFLFF